jgi:5-methylcytosine-specific restriction endonuclease McrA
MRRDDLGMLEGKQPLTRRGLERAGTCAICGTVGALTDTHVPPAAAGNRAIATPLVTVADGSGRKALTGGRPREGGTRAYLLCGSCNHLAGNLYDPTFVDVWKALGKDLLLGDTMGPIGSSCRIGIRPVKAGAFVRSVLAGLMGFCSTLRVEYPGIQAAVLTGDATEPPADLHLLFAIYAGPDRWVGGGGVTRVDVRDGSDVRMTHTFAEMAWPPFFFALTDDSGLAAWPGCPDLLAYLRVDAAVLGELELTAPRLQPDHPLAAAIAGPDGRLESVDAPGGGRMFSTGFDTYSDDSTAPE